AAGAASATRAFAETAASTLKEIRVGYQKNGILVIARQQATLEKHFAAQGVSIRWVEFFSGPPMMEAMGAGSIEFGAVGDSPPVFAQAAGKDLVYVGAEPPKPESSAILTQADSALRTLADLKGRKVALQKGSSAHYLLLRAVEKAGLQWDQIQPIYLSPADARAAFERKSVDAWAIWDPFYAATELAVQPRVLSNGRGLSNNNSFYLASKAFATQHGPAIAVLFEELTRADRLAQDDRKQAIQLISDFSGLDAGVVSLFLTRRPRSPVAPLASQTVADQQRVAQAFFKSGLIPKPVTVADAVWRAEPRA
uniref:sulfonate ABC transporter substrate-binding protein n=1 Tax=Rhodoferax sp. TaxID=50421 RepID=UPI00374D31D9